MPVTPTKYCDPEVLEKGLNIFIDPAITYEYHVCKDVPASHANLVAMTLGSIAMDETVDMALIPYGTGNLDRKVAVYSSNLTISLTSDGEANHFAIVNATDSNAKQVLYATPIITPQWVLQGNELTSADWEIQLNQPV